MMRTTELVQIDTLQDSQDVSSPKLCVFKDKSSLILLSRLYVFHVFPQGRYMSFPSADSMSFPSADSALVHLDEVIECDGRCALFKNE